MKGPVPSFLPHPYIIAFQRPCHVIMHINQARIQDFLKGGGGGGGGVGGEGHCLRDVIRPPKNGHCLRDVPGISGRAQPSTFLGGMAITLSAAQSPPYNSKLLRYRGRLHLHFQAIIQHEVILNIKVSMIGPMDTEIDISVNRCHNERKTSVRAWCRPIFWTKI